MSSFTMTPTATTIARTRTAVLAGSGTTWSTATTFVMSGGIGTLTVVSFTSATQKLTATWSPGPSTGTFVISNSSDANTVGVQVAATQVFSHTALTTWSSNPQWIFSTSANEIPADAVGHIFTIVDAGTGFTTGSYAINAVNVNQNLGTQGFHNIAQLCIVNSSTVGAATTAQSGGSGSWFMGPGGSGFGGGNLIARWKGSNASGYDPDAPANSGMNGLSATVSGGTGVTAGTYTVNSFNTAFATGANGTQNLMTFNAAVGASGWYGATWAQAGGNVIPTPIVRPTFTGAINILFVGDSITQRVTNTLTAVQGIYPSASTAICTNFGKSGSMTSDWLPGATAGYFTAAVSQANTQSATIVNIMLGTNDAIHASLAVTAHQANMQSLVNSLTTAIPTLRAIVVNEQPALGAAVSGQVALNTLLTGYYASYSGVTGAIQGFSSTASATITNFPFFLANPQDSQDGIHPTVAGYNEINYTWITSLNSSITASTALATLSVSPNTAAVNSSSLITATGTNTNWTTATTFTISGLGGTVTGVTVTTATQKAVGTWVAGSTTGAFVLSDSSDSATAGLTLFAASTASGWVTGRPYASLGVGVWVA